MEKNKIIQLKIEGYSNRAIAQKMGINRKTVARYWNEHKSHADDLAIPFTDVHAIQEKMAGEPKYNAANRKSRKYTDEIDRCIDQILEAEAEKDKLLGNHKQSLTLKQIHEVIVSQGFDIGRSTVSSVIKSKRAKAKECFIKQEYDFGSRLEYDFGEVKLIINGKVKKYYMAVLSSPSGRFRWAYLYANQNMEAFLDSQVRFFHMIGGIYDEMVYDNMRNVVSKFIGRNEKELNQNLVTLANYYGFKINVTNCFKGNEKGYVESSVKKIRNTVFAKTIKFESLQDAEIYLEKELKILNETSAIQEEKAYLKPLKPKFELAKIEEKKVNKYSLVQIHTNLYSVPDYLVGKTITARIYAKEVKLSFKDQLVCIHKKKDGAREVSIDITHYLATLARKPGALRNSTALKSVPRLKSIFDIHFSTNPKKFIEILEENKEKSLDDLLDSLNQYIELGTTITSNHSEIQVGQVISKTRYIIASYNQLVVGGVR